MTRVRIDSDLCIGTADCERLAPAAFRLDDMLGVAVPLPGVATTPRDVLDLAAIQCPTHAIIVIEDDEPATPA